jgi:toxin ParE1/3/4
VDLHEEAAAEYDAAFDWYLARSPAAALKFDAEFDRALVHVAQAPQRWASGSHNTPQVLAAKVSFLLIYRERFVGEIQIVAVAHTSRRPGYWKDRI